MILCSNNKFTVLLLFKDSEYQYQVGSLNYDGVINSNVCNVLLLSILSNVLLLLRTPK